jgi:hypothetical protein
MCNGRFGHAGRDWLGRVWRAGRRLTARKQNSKFIRSFAAATGAVLEAGKIFKMEQLRRQRT